MNGPGERPTAQGILADLNAEAALQALHAGHDEPAPAPVWDADPVPLSARRLLPPFPTDALPGWVAEQVAAIAEFSQTPADLPGCIALAALSAAAGGKAVVRVRAGWQEPVNLYTAVAMPPGSRKSAVFAAMTGPLLAAEATLIETARPAIVDAELALRVAKARAERTARAAETALTGPARTQAIAEASAAAAAVQTIVVPPVPRLVADDITPEAAASLLAEQGGRLAVLSAEGGIFHTLAGRYTGTPNLEAFLKGHAGDLLRVDRKGRPAEHIDRPALTLGLAIQPELLADIARLPGFRGRGLLARILYALPANTVGRRRIGPPAPPAHVLAAYEGTLRALVLSLAHQDPPAVLTLTGDADARVLQLEAELEPQLAPDGGLGHIADWASKLTGTTCRLAGLLHLADRLRSGWTQPINATTVDRAARLGRYYLAHALAAFDHMGADPLVEAARAVLDRIGRIGQPLITRRELFSGALRSRFPTITDLDPPLGLLEEHGWIRRVPDPGSSGPGRRPSVAYAVHPKACAQCAECAQP